MKITTTINGNEVTTEGTIEEVCDFLRKIKEDDQDELVNKKEDNVEQEKNPLNLEDDKIYYIKPLRDDIDKVSGAVRLSIDEISYLFIEEETRNMVLVYFDDIDKINEIEFYEDDELYNEDMIVGEKYYVEKIVDDVDSDDVLYGEIELRRISDEYYIFYSADEDDDISVYKRFDTIKDVEFLTEEEYKNGNNKSELKIEDLKNGTYFIEGKIEDRFGDFVHNEYVELTNKINEGLVRIDSKESILPVVMKTNDFEEQLKNVKLIPKLEETEENQTKFERGNIVEVLDSIYSGGVKEGNYGIVLGYDSDGDVNLAGFDETGIFSTMWFHAEDDLKLIKE
ncbi:hypothetical protein CoNPh15_CDS0119 [Staphylococcus phage S-CoN_Ph15]|nr:hypothetical protein CoNPh14_CDS0053 [Staphylococcus phage S-CoN_Ph14]WNM53965.1 hypothetical protein CoNPh15_CDS0119 [Staphylococcus phage S-CoN_Ph15]WNM54075.1 hypothetical protein CoNPh16_CDS0060 [Staphylococcus phage S-CoN_Ph16]